MAKISIKESKCPCCGASIELKDNGYGETKCKYCNAIVFISREDTNDGFITIKNKADGKPISYISIPLNWDITDSYIDYNKSTLRIPYAIGFNLENTSGDLIHVESGNSFEINGGVAWVNRQTPRTIQEEFMPVEQYLDEYIKSYDGSMNNEFKFIEDLDIPIDNYNAKDDFERTKKLYEERLKSECAKLNTKFILAGMYSKCGCRAYEVGDKVFVVYTKVHGWKTRLAFIPELPNLAEGLSNLTQGLGNLMGNISNKVNNTTTNSNGNILNKMADSGLLGGMLGKKFKSQNNQKPVEEVKTEPVTIPNTEPIKEEKEEVVEQTDPNMIGNMNHPGQGEVLEWQSTPIFVLVTTKDNYKNLYKKAYQQVCSSFRFSEEVEREYQQLTAQYEQEAQAMYNEQAAAQKAHGDALIQMGQQRMQANYAYIDSMRARSNAQYESNRASYNSRMAAQDRMRDARTEATLGVNTYIKPDGKEVQVPVSADTAWINGKGEIVGGSVGFDPGSGWTKLERK